MLTTLFLDAAGTLIHPAEPVGETYARVFQQFGASIPPSTISTTFPKAFRQAPPPTYADHPDGHTAEKARWRVLVHTVLHASGPAAATLADSPAFPPCFEALYSHFAHPDAWALFPDTLPFLQSASAHFRLAVVSNFDQRLHPVLDGLGLSPFFELILTSGEARASKPDPAIFQQALTVLQITPSETAHLGDCPHADLAGARAAGLTAFLLDRPRLSLPDLLEFCRPRTN